MLEDYIIFKGIKVISELLKWYKGIQGKSSQTGVGYQEKMNNGWMNVHACAWSCLPTEKPMKSRSWWCSTNWKRTSSSNLIKKTLDQQLRYTLLPSLTSFVSFPLWVFYKKTGSKCALHSGDCEHGPSEPTELNPKKNHWPEKSLLIASGHWQMRQKEHKPPWEGAMTGIFE